MRLKIAKTGLGIEDSKFRCFYKLHFDDDDERKAFVAKLQHQPEAWDQTVTWVVDPKNNYVEAYIEVANTQKDDLLAELNNFLDETPKDSLITRIWKNLQRPYWWWKTRKL